MTRYVGPIAPIRELKDWSAVKPPAPGWVLDQEALDGFGFHLIEEGRRPSLGMQTTLEFAEELRRNALGVPGTIALGSLEEARRMADISDREADIRENTRNLLVVLDGTGSSELRRVDVTGLPDDLVERIRDNLVRAYSTGADIVVQEVQSIYGRDVAPESATQASGPRP